MIMRRIIIICYTCKTRILFCWVMRLSGSRHETKKRTSSWHCVIMKEISWIRKSYTLYSRVQDIKRKNNQKPQDMKWKATTRDPVDPSHEHRTTSEIAVTVHQKANKKSSHNKMCCLVQQNTPTTHCVLNTVSHSVIVSIYIMPTLVALGLYNC